VTSTKKNNNEQIQTKKLNSNKIFCYTRVENNGCQNGMLVLRYMIRYSRTWPAEAAISITDLTSLSKTPPQMTADGRAASGTQHGPGESPSGRDAGCMSIY